MDESYCARHIHGINRIINAFGIPFAFDRLMSNAVCVPLYPNLSICHFTSGNFETTSQSEVLKSNFSFSLFPMSKVNKPAKIKFEPVDRVSVTNIVMKCFESRR